MSEESLISLARQLRVCSEALKQDVHTADSLLSTIDSLLSREDLNSFIVKIQHSTPECLQLSDTLLALATHLEGIYESYRQVDQSLIQNFEKLN